MPPQRRLLLVGGVSPPRQLQQERQDAVRLHAGVHRQQIQEVLGQQTATHQQGHRERHFDHNQAGQEPTAGPFSIRAAHPTLERRVEVHLRGSERGREPEQQSCQHGHGQREEQHRRIEAQRGVEPAVRHDSLGGPNEPMGDQETQRASQHGQQDALGQDLPEDSPAAGPESGANGHLPRPSGRAGEQHASDVRRDQQQQAPCDRKEQREGHRRLFANKRLGRRDDDAPTLVGFWILAFERAGDVGHVGACLLQRHTRLEPSHQEVVLLAPMRGRRVLAQGHPELGPWRPGQHHAVRHHADDRVRLPVEDRDASDDVGTPAEAPLPGGGADEGHIRRARRVFPLGEEPPKDGTYCEHAEGAGGREVARDTLSLRAVGEDAASRREDRDLLEHRVSLTPVQEIAVVRADASSDVACLESHQSLGFWKRVRADQPRLRSGEDRGVRADAQGEGQHGEDRRLAMLGQHAQGESQILNNAVHQHVSPRTGRHAVLHCGDSHRYLISPGRTLAGHSDHGEGCCQRQAPDRPMPRSRDRQLCCSFLVPRSYTSRSPCLLIKK